MAQRKRLPEPFVRTIRKNLLAWFEKNARDLPWRTNRTGYRVWLSEIMLQQTRVETVIPYYQRFLETWPTLQDLAQASLDQVLKAWEGLGYYSRARNLHRAAQIVVRELGGHFPQTYAQVRALPGIGDYTAGAITSLAFQERQAAVDGNVIRVCSRLLAKKWNPSHPKTRQVIREMMMDLLPEKCPGALNEAFMELGATICTPRNPHCEACPIKGVCRAETLNRPEDYPGKKTLTKMARKVVGVAVIQDGKRFLLLKNPQRSLLGGLWSFPIVPLDQPIRENGRLRTFREKAKKRYALDLTIQSALPIFRHLFTHIDMEIHPFHCRPVGRIPKALPIPGEYQWLTLELISELALSKAHRKIANLL